MKRLRTIGIAAAVAGAALGGAVAGSAIQAVVNASAATPSPAAAASPAPFKSNEDPTHEQGETAAQEAAENNCGATLRNVETSKLTS